MPTIRDLVAKAQGTRNATRLPRTRDAAVGKFARDGTTASSSATARNKAAVASSATASAFAVPASESLGLKDSAMSTSPTPLPPRSRLQIDYTIGFSLCIAGAVVFAAGLSAWLVILSDLSELKDRLAALRMERFDIATDVRSRIEALSTKLDAIDAQIDHVEAAGRQTADTVDARLSRLVRLEEEISKLRQETPGEGERRETMR